LEDPAFTQVVESIHDNIESFKVGHVELRLLDIAMDGIYFSPRVESAGGLFGDLIRSESAPSPIKDIWLANHSLGALDMLFLEEKLPIQVRKVDGV
jgi:hypothetical protein